MIDTKNDILKACLKYFLQHGIRKMSNDKLAGLLGISTKTFYKYFENKEQLLEEASHLFHTQQYQRLENLSIEQNAACQLFDLWLGGVEIEYKVNKAFFQDLHYYYPEVAEKVESAISKKFKKQFILIIRRGMKEGDFSENIIPEVALEGIFVLYSALVRTEHFKSFKLSSSAAMLNTIALYIRGFCTHKGLEQLDANIEKLHRSEKSNSSKAQVVVNA
jgi:AcrR family transcriptional regulator